MIRTFNCEYVQNLLTSAASITRRLLLLQFTSIFSTLVFLSWQAIITARIFNLFFTVAWVVLEGVTVVWECKVGRTEIGGKTASW